MREINRTVVERFRSGGELPHGMHHERLVLLTTRGQRTGREHTTPMMFHADDDRLLVIASNAGATRHPDWYHNLVADPHVTVEVGTGGTTGGRGVARYEALAAPLAGEDRERTWAMLKQTYPFLVDHEKQAARDIPVVALTRV